jgi:hypothetical protein
VLIFVFAGVSCGRSQPILAEFAAVPNVQPVVNPAASAAAPAPDLRPSAELPTPTRTGVNQAGVEIGGPRGPEPTRFGDWERNGRCVDF